MIKENITEKEAREEKKKKRHRKRFNLVLDEMSIGQALGVNRKMKSYMGMCFLSASENDKC